MELDAYKQTVRQTCRDLRRSMPEAERQAADQIIADKALRLPPVSEAALLLCYVSAPLEVSTRTLLDVWLRQGRPLAAPRCLPDSLDRWSFG